MYPAIKWINITVGNNALPKQIITKDKTKSLLHFYVTKDTSFTIDDPVLQVSPECQISKFRSFYTHRNTFSGT